MIGLPFAYVEVDDKLIFAVEKHIDTDEYKNKKTWKSGIKDEVIDDRF